MGNTLQAQLDRISVLHRGDKIFVDGELRLVVEQITELESSEIGTGSWPSSTFVEIIPAKYTIYLREGKCYWLKHIKRGKPVEGGNYVPTDYTAMSYVTGIDAGSGNIPAFVPPSIDAG